MENNLKYLEQLTERYIEAEEFLLKLRWWEKILFYRKLNKFLESRKKYNF